MTTTPTQHAAAIAAAIAAFHAGGTQSALAAALATALAAYDDVGGLAERIEALITENATIIDSLQLFAPKGAVDLVSNLPTDEDLGAFYVVTSGEFAGHGYVLSAGGWDDLGLVRGASAYQVWVAQPGNAGKTEAEYLTWLANAQIEAVQPYLDDAEAAATAAAGSASTASTKAGEASASATAAAAAKTAAETAQGLAEDARDDAQASATAASGSASTASTKAGEASASATAAASAKTAAETAQAAAEAARDEAESIVGGDFIARPGGTTMTGKVLVATSGDGGTVEGRAIGAAAAGDILDRQTGDARYRTEAQVSTAISTAIDALVAGAPGALDTLAELAAALGDEQDAVAALTAAVAGKQASNANLTAFAGLTGANNKLAYFTGASALALTDFTAFGRTLLGLADYAALKTDLALGLSDVSGLSAALDAKAPAARTISASGLASGGGDLTSNRTITVTAATASDMLAGTASDKAVTPAASKSALAFVAATDGATITLDLAAGVNHRVTLAGNRTLAAPTGAKEGYSGLIQISQDGTGNRTLSVNSAWKFAGGAPTLSTGANKVDAIAYTVISESGPVIRAVLIKDFA